MSITSKNNIQFICKILKYNSKEQLESIEIRREILRKPLGLDFSESELEFESTQIHIGCFNDKKLIGILILNPILRNGFTIYKMRQVAVLSELQGRGVGTKMISFSEKWARDMNCKMLELHARKNVIPFYEGLGYHCEGAEFLEVGIPHFKMIKQL